MKAARKCGHIREMRSMRLSRVRSKCLQRNLLQNPLEQQIALESAVVPKTVLIQIGLQILRAHVVVDASDSTLNSAPESLDGVGVNVARNVHVLTVANAPMGVSEIRQPVIRNVVVSKNDAARQHILFDQTVKSFLFGVRSYTCHNAATALYHTDNRYLVASNGRTPVATPFSAVIHLIYFNRRSLQLQILRKKLADLLEHAPRSFVGNACLTLNLLRGDSTASGTHQIHCVKPCLERSSGLLKDSASERVDVMAAKLARVSGAIPNAIVLGVFAALHAIRRSAPSLFFDIGQTRGVVRKLVIEVSHRVAQLFGNALLRLHTRLTRAILANHVLVVKG